MPFLPHSFTYERNQGERTWEINSIMSSVGSSVDSRYQHTKQRGIPKRCNCGKAVHLFTSTTVKNPEDCSIVVRWDLRWLVVFI
ncbi:hypothetical protein Bca52824_081925 [Brassica carinata]|uniref:Uncharacterized protein n=1 Tax=Brassica carinata TaxID=52824 RepID=A0A8X7TS26_BRACI|nr:hypothetical protein Bca52824_081925 [Brassica carinata]